MKSKIHTVLHIETINRKYFIKHNQAQLDLYFKTWWYISHSSLKERKKNYDLYYKITLSTAQFLKVTKFITNLMMYSNVLLKSKLKESTIDNTINIHRREKKTWITKVDVGDRHNMQIKHISPLLLSLNFLNAAFHN